MEKMSLKSLEKKIKKLNNLYRKGDSKVSDYEYDSLIEQLRALDPNNKLLSKGIIETSNKDMVSLPTQMGSLNKVKNIKELKKWLSRFRGDSVVITPKYDGISLLVDVKDHKAYTRGDGFKGQLRSKHFDVMCGHIWPSSFNGLIWGEAIIRNQYFYNRREKSSYKNPRNAVAGIFNSPDGYKNKICDGIDFIVYGADCQPSIGYKSDFLSNPGITKVLVTPYHKYDVQSLLSISDDELFRILDEFRSNFTDIYNIDGVVIEIDSYIKRSELGRLSNGNPAYAIAYKDPQWDVLNRTTVKGIELSVAKGGKISPVIVIDPVEVDGVTIERVTGYNMRYILENHICPGAEIGIIRSGGVIPKHVRTFIYCEQTYDKFFRDHITDGKCPLCGEPVYWNESGVDLVCKNKKCSGVIISRIVSFFEKLGCEGFSEPTITKIFNAGFKTIGDILTHISVGNDFSDIIGPAKSKQMIDQILSHRYPSLSVYIDALNLSDGMVGAKTYQAVFDYLGSKKEVQRVICTAMYPSIDGFGWYLRKKLAHMSGIGGVKMMFIVKSLFNYMKEFTPTNTKGYPIFRPRIKITKKPKKVYGTICFTGFRDKELADNLTKNGFLVTDNFTKDCTLLVAKDPNSGSSKLKKAIEKGVQVMSIDELKEYIQKL